MNRKKIFLFISLFLLLTGLSLLFVLSPSRQSEIKLGIFHPLTPLNPFKNEYSISSNLMDLVFDPLIRIEPSGKIIAALAESWHFDPSRQGWVFEIRDNVHFHDGKKLEIEDVLYSLKQIADSQKTGLSNLYSSIEQFQKMDERSFLLKLKNSDSSFWAALQQSKIVPKDFLGSIHSSREFEVLPIGTGPYKVLSQDSKEIILSANEHYFETRPKLQIIRMLSFENEQAVLNQLISEKIDFIFLLSPKDYGAAERIPNFRVYENCYPLLYALMFNFKNPPFQERQFREALDLAIDKKRLIEDVLHQHGFLSEGTKQEPPSNLELYQPLESKRILSSLGWVFNPKNGLLEKDGKQLEFKVSHLMGDEIALHSLRIIQENFLDLGISMKTEALKPSDFVRTVVQEKNFDMSFTSSVFRPYYQNEYGYFHSSQINQGLNFSSYQNKALDQALERYRYSSQDSLAYESLQGLLIEQKPALFLFWRKIPTVIHKRFKGISESSTEPLRDLMYVWEES